VSFLNADHPEAKSGAGKFVLLALALLIVAGGMAYWFLGRAPTPEPAPEVPPPTVEKKAPPALEAKPPKADIPTTGSVEVTANVDGASVYIDGEQVGDAPFANKAIRIGRYEVRVTKDGYADLVEGVRVRPGKTVELHASLELLPPSLRVESDVPGATVFLDREYKGTTPVDIKNVTPGEHQLTVSADGYDMHSDTVSVTTGHQDVKVNFQQAVAEFRESIAVIHKHSFGKCQGTLVADADGLRYETDNKKDAFAVPYSALERFEVDYIAKNMNLKIKKGKNYNFTAQSGDADALFVFHKNVQAFLDKM